MAVVPQLLDDYFWVVTASGAIAQMLDFPGGVLC
jgi:hypothetical protein